MSGPSRTPGGRRDAAEEPDEIEAVCSALAHPARRRILLALHFRGGSMTAGEIADRSASSWPTTTRHLGVLRQAGLVRVEKRGRERLYHLQVSRLKGVLGGWLKWFDTRR